jgi:hypothetical protein
MTRLFTQEAVRRNNEKTGVQPADDFLSFTLWPLARNKMSQPAVFLVAAALPGNLSHNNTPPSSLSYLDGHRRERDNYFWPPEKRASNLQD